MSSHRNYKQEKLPGTRVCHDPGKNHNKNGDKGCPENMWNLHN